MSASPRMLKWAVCGAAVLAAAVLFYWRGQRAQAAAAESYRWVVVQKTDFKQTVRRRGVLKPLNEEHIIGKMRGTILDITPQGRAVNTGDLVLSMDPTPHEDAKTAHECWIAQIKAEQEKQRQWEAMSLNEAREVVSSLDLTVELEQRRLDELKKGPDAADVINAKTALENARNLFEAATEEFKALEELAKSGFYSSGELRQKELALHEQQLAVNNAGIAQRKLFIPDPVKLAEQELKVRDTVKNREAAKERADLLQHNIERDEESRKRRMNREQEWLKKLTENIEKCYYRAPGPGLVVYKKNRWYTYAPGRDVQDGWEVMSLPDFSRMKVALTVDEAHIAAVALGQAAEIRPAGWNGAPFRGKVSKIAEKGHDEFELCAEETVGITGTANRQVFDVEVELDGQSPAFRLGLRAEAAIIVKELKQVLAVPRMALLREKDGSMFVRVPGRGGSEMRSVSVRAENDFTAVVDGVNENERVLVLDAQN